MTALVSPFRAAALGAIWACVGGMVGMADRYWPAWPAWPVVAATNAACCWTSWEFRGAYWKIAITIIKDVLNYTLRLDQTRMVYLISYYCIKTLIINTRGTDWNKLHAHQLMCISPNVTLYLTSHVNCYFSILNLCLTNCYHSQFLR